MEDFLCFHVFIPKHTGTHTPYINWLVVAPYPSEKWWSSSIGMMTFPIYGKMKVMFQTTNYYIPLKTPLNPIKKPMSSRCSRDATNDLKDDPCPGHTDVHHVPSSWFITSPMHTDTLYIYIISVTYNMYLYIYIYVYIRVYYIYICMAGLYLGGSNMMKISWPIPTCPRQRIVGEILPVIGMLLVDRKTNNTPSSKKNARHCTLLDTT